LGQAAHTPREGSPERTSDSTKPEPATQASDTAESQSRERDDAADDNRSRSTDQDSAEDHGGDGSGQAQAAATVVDRKPAAAKDKAAEKNADDPAEAKTIRSTGKPGKLKGKSAHGNAPGESGEAANAPTATENAQHAAIEQVTDATGEDSQSEPGVQGDGGPTRNSLALDGANDSAINGNPSSITAAGVVASANESRASDSNDGLASAESGAVAAIGGERVENAAKTESKSGGKRGRGAKDAAANDSIGPTAGPVVGSRVPAATASTAIESPATADLLATKDAAVDKQPAATDAAPNENNNSAEPRAGAAAAATAARHERFQGTVERTDGLTEAERVRFVQRVARAFHSMGDEGGEVRLRLSPPELGSLRLEVSVRDGVMSARLETETASARNVLLENLPALRERLAEQNIKVERFEVDVRDQQRQPSHEQFAGQPDVPRQGQRERPRGHELKRAGAIEPGAARGPIRGNNPGELNIVI
jgi:flagellar hook-length control protein FliK